MRRALLLSAVALGCAAPQRAAPSAGGAVYETQALRPGGSVPVVSAASASPAPELQAQPAEPFSSPRVVLPAPSPAPPASVAQQPLDTPRRPESHVGGGASDGTATAVDVEAALRVYEARLGAAVTLLRADAATCRDVCGASTTICRAAAEICRLTGDDDREARHPRCRSARLSCAEAGRQRDGACPTCPDAR